MTSQSVAGLQPEIDFEENELNFPTAIVVLNLQCIDDSKTWSILSQLVPVQGPHSFGTTVVQDPTIPMPRNFASRAIICRFCRNFVSVVK
jgi:hypothetical protein